MKKGLLIALALILVPLIAFGVTKSQDTIYLAEDEIVNDNYFTYGNTITIDGTVNGDLIAFGNSITVNGAVLGDVIAGATTITINGDVGGNIRAAGNTVEINSKVERNVNAFGSSVTLGKDASIGWSFISGAGTTNVRGEVAGNVQSYGGDILIGNSIGNNVIITLDPESTLTVISSAVISGDLTYSGENEADIDSGATITGETIHKISTEGVQKATSFLSSYLLLFKLIGLFAILFAGVIIVSFFPNKLRKLLDISRTTPATTLLSGILTLLLTPLLIVILLVSLIGVPVGLILTAFYVIAIYLSTVIVGSLVGQYILQLFKKDTASRSSLFWSMMLGTTIFYAATNTPIIGWLIGFIGTIWGLGTIVEHVRRHRGQVHE
ncbi:hypothetical protein ACFL0L_02690 [Patescibacteria group bacterium]